MAEERLTSLEKKVVRTSPALWFLGLLLALFLAGLGSLVLEDVASFIPPPDRDTYDAVTVKPLADQLAKLQGAPNPRAAQLERLQSDLDEQERVLATAEASWRTWLETRATLGKADSEDREVRDRRNHLDVLRTDRDTAEKALADLRAEPDPREAQQADLETRLATAREAADREYATAMAAWRWKVLAVRLAIIIPIWALAVYLWSRRQQSSFITLLWGYWGFAAWMLLYGVVPYLPNYGGYVPLLLGAGTTVWVSIGMVRHFNRQADQRRRRLVDRAVARHQCPGCERDYLIGRESGIDAGLARKATVSHYDAESLRPHNCPACGLPLFGPCGTCGHLQIVHQDFCTVCGAPWRAADPPLAVAAPSVG